MHGCYKGKRSIGEAMLRGLEHGELACVSAAGSPFALFTLGLFDDPLGKPYHVMQFCQPAACVVRWTLSA